MTCSYVKYKTQICTKMDLTQKAEVFNAFYQVWFLKNLINGFRKNLKSSDLGLEKLSKYFEHNMNLS